MNSKIASYIKAKSYRELLAKVAADPPSSRDRELSFLLAQLEKGAIPPEEFTRKFRRLWKDPGAVSTLMRDPSSGNLYFTQAWLDAHVADMRRANDASGQVATFGHRARAAYYDLIFQVREAMASTHGPGFSVPEARELVEEAVSEYTSVRALDFDYLDGYLKEQVLEELGEDYYASWLWLRNVSEREPLVGVKVDYPAPSFMHLSLDSEDAVEEAFRKGMRFIETLLDYAERQFPLFLEDLGTMWDQREEWMHPSEGTSP